MSINFDLWSNGHQLRECVWRALPREGEHIQLGQVGGGPMTEHKVIGIVHELDTGHIRVYLGRDLK